MRKISLLCVFTILLCSLVCTANAASVNSDYNANESITMEERLFLQGELASYGYGDENFSVDVLYDSNGNPGYLLGITANGYIIFERDSHRFQECGEGSNPYSRYMDFPKYYGGPICYFVKLSEAQRTAVASGEGSGEYFDIIRETYRSSVPTLDRQSVDEQAEQETFSGTSADAGIASTASSIRLPNSYSYIQRKAFGYNNDNTCSAVATGILLNYIAL